MWWVLWAELGDLIERVAKTLELSHVAFSLILIGTAGSGLAFAALSQLYSFYI